VSTAGPAIIQYWDNEEAPAEVAALLATFEAANPDLPHLVFSERRAAELIAERFGPRHAEAFAACAVPAMQADYFRYCALHALGGVYVDADFRCVAPLRPLLDESAGGTLFGRAQLPRPWRLAKYEWRERAGPYRVIMNSIFAFPSPGHPLLELGSFDAFLAYAEGGVLEPYSRPICETVGDHDRVVRAFAGVSLAPEEETRAFVGGSEIPLPYKQTEDHWMNVTASIYRLGGGLA
jgi:hypothetical protein